MSFAQDVKKELTLCSIDEPAADSELIALLMLTGSIHIIDKRLVLELKTENSATSRRIYSLFKTIFQLKPTVIVTEKNKLQKKPQFIIRIIENSQQVLERFKLSLDHFAQAATTFTNTPEKKAGFLRGAFLATGSVNNPKQSSYHLEIATQYENQAQQLQYLMKKLDFNARITSRRNGYIVYLKEAEKISDFLQILGATEAMLYFEDVRIVRDMRNSVNRVVNCETANMNKVIIAAQQQIDNIKLIYEVKGEQSFPDRLRSVAELRLKYPEASTEQLSRLLQEEMGEVVSKSGINYRLRKINTLAQQIRGVQK
ncbi:DNA-binding protein WhiA [Xylocopilactobacillus apicola]|uniref:Probable cell division protein WhiA n=1 Tax=Xylocopilactobacillus apicola TaxID=2932184 RepID=A0AAU9CZV6_9LACO|nr:DNA-binding protein WhiA [Xylocopilactobacillus apicola]BDR57966.1 putative sporulation transcription regulator WhiA [Xylocopilactobacillus apicola]